MKIAIIYNTKIVVDYSVVKGKQQFITLQNDCNEYKDQNKCKSCNKYQKQGTPYCHTKIVANKADGVF